MLQLKAGASFESGKTKMRDLGEASHPPLSIPRLLQASVVHPGTKMACFDVIKLDCSRAEGLKHNMILLYGILYSFPPMFSVKIAMGRRKSYPCLAGDES